MTSPFSGPSSSGPSSSGPGGSDPGSGASDELLLAGYAASDPAATSAFVDRFQRRVYGLALTIVGERSAAEDVAQEALVRAWRHADAFDARRGRVATWLLAITRNAAVDALRVRRPVAVDPDDLLADLPAAATRDPGDVVALHGDVADLQAALRSLPTEQRRAVVMAGIWGLTGREIAEREGIPLGTAKTRIRAGMQRLRVELLDAQPVR
jgi:RNA polymerase sigma-70 factor (ECF subfamily)